VARLVEAQGVILRGANAAKPLDRYRFAFEDQEASAPG
jgi:hypothetical protein